MEAETSVTASSAASDETSFSTADSDSFRLSLESVPDLPVVAILRGAQSEWRVLAHSVGKGAAGKVFPAFSSKFKLDGAVKVVALCDDGSKPTGFTKEVDMLRRLAHNNIVRLHDVAEEEQCFPSCTCMVLEKMLCSLQIFVGTKRKFPPNLLPKYLRQVLTGLNYLHGEGIVHGDLKPENILVSPLGTLKLADFEVSLSPKLGKNGEREDLIGRASCVGTPPYMPPDFDEYSGLTFAFDVWSFGVLIVVLGTGKLPDYFSELDDSEDVWPRVRQVTAEKVLTARVNEALGSGLTGLVERCLKAVAAARPNCSELLSCPLLQPAKEWTERDVVPVLCAKAVSEAWDPSSKDPWCRSLWLTDGLLFGEALTFYKQQLGSDHPKVATCMSHFAHFYRDQGKYKEALSLYQEALRIERKNCGDNHPNVAVHLNNIADLYIDLGWYSEAEKLHESALNILWKSLDIDHLHVASTMHNLGNSYRCQGKYREAEPMYEESLRIRKEQLGDDHLDVAASLNNLASLYREQHKYAKAMPLYEESLRIRKKQLGEEHPDLAIVLNNLAMLHFHLGNYATAESISMEAIGIQKKQLGGDHPAVAACLNTLAVLYGEQGKFTDAESQIQETLKIQRMWLGEDHPDVGTSLNNLAILKRRLDNDAAAESLFLDALRIRRQKLGENHEDVAATQYNLANLYMDQGKSDKAEQLYNEALRVFSLRHDKDHRHVAAARRSLEAVQEIQRAFAAAQSLFPNALPEEALRSHDHPDLAICMSNLAELYLIQRNEAAAKPLLLDSGRILKQHFPTPLHRACVYGDRSAAERLLHDKVDVNVAASKTGLTPLHLALKNGNRQVAELLLEHKAELDCVDSRGHTPLSLTCLHGDASTAQLLVEHKADVSQRLGDGDCPLFLCCRLGHADVVEALAVGLPTEGGASLAAEALVQCVRGSSALREVSAEEDRGRRKRTLCDVCQRKGTAYSNREDDFDVCKRCYQEGYRTYALLPGREAKIPRRCDDLDNSTALSAALRMLPHSTDRAPALRESTLLDLPRLTCILTQPPQLSQKRGHQ
eukprot:RCo000871